MDKSGERAAAERIQRLEDPDNNRYLSGEELRTFLDPGPEWRIADLGSGTGFYTREIAPAVGTVYAVDINPEMHRYYRRNGMASNVVTLTADVARLPFGSDELDGAVSTRTFHHGLDEVLPEVARTLRPGGPLVIVDWSATGANERETSRDEEYFDIATTQSLLLDAGFRIRNAEERRETFIVTATAR